MSETSKQYMDDEIFNYFNDKYPNEMAKVLKIIRDSKKHKELRKEGE